jgi:hypothetical protein
MWFGLQLPEPAAGGKATVYAYAPDGVFRVHTAPDDLPLILLLLRDAAGKGVAVADPSCPACGAPFHLPPPEVLEEPCTSA